MSAQPRIVFTRFASRESLRVVRWQEHAARVTGRRMPVESARQRDETVIVWSLVSGNNRELARCTKIYRRFDDAVADAGQAIDARDRAEIRLVNDRAVGGYGWHLAHPSSPDVICARWYDSDRDRRASVATAIASLAAATLAPGVRMAMAYAAGGLS